MICGVLRPGSRTCISCAPRRLGRNRSPSLHALRLLPRLHTFALTKGHRYADESMRRSALRVFNALAPSASVSATQTSSQNGSGSLGAMSVRCARAACPQPPQQEGTYERIFPPPTPRISDNMRMRRRRSGSEREGAMVEAWERGFRAVGGAFERRYRFALPLVQQQGVGAEID
ncbi:hypothetical protein B0H13DRAFT_2305153 [Mycena leptocephala]|nr:hypothetical protein B0H13DRAFT_2305153 [Mycena leptocephala]